MILSCSRIPNTPFRLTTRSCCWRRNRPMTVFSPKPYARCSGRSMWISCARRTCARPPEPRTLRPMPSRGGCGRKLRNAGAQGADSRKTMSAEIKARLRLTSIPAAVHQRARLDPGHHPAQLFTDLLDRVRGHLGAHRLERGLVHPVLQHPVLGELARLDVVENALHLGARLGRDHARARDVLAIL